MPSFRFCALWGPGSAGVDSFSALSAAAQWIEPTQMAQACSSIPQIVAVVCVGYLHGPFQVSIYCHANCYYITCLMNNYLRLHCVGAAINTKKFTLLHAYPSDEQFVSNQDNPNTRSNTLRKCLHCTLALSHLTMAHCWVSHLRKFIQAIIAGLGNFLPHIF